MSANVDLVRSLFADWERGDFGRVDWADSGIEYCEVGGLEPGNWTGIAAMAAAWARVLSAWDAFRIDAEDFMELDAERVLVLVQPSGHGRTSGVDIQEIHARGAVLLHVRGNTLTRFVLYWDRDRAYADLGLAPDSRSAPRSTGREQSNPSPRGTGRREFRSPFR